MSESINNVVPEKIHLLKTNVFKFNLHSSEDYMDNPVEYDSLKISMGKDVAHNFEEGLSRYRLHFVFDAISEKEELLGLSAKVGIEFHFKVDNFNDFIRAEKDGIKVNIDIGSSLMAIAYSTSRGIILEKTQNSFFNGIIIPVIDSTKFLLEEERV